MNNEKVHPDNELWPNSQLIFILACLSTLSNVISAVWLAKRGPFVFIKIACRQPERRNKPPLSGM